MAQIKMRYGIDLGTTNSSICRMENGSPSIRKTDTLKDTLPSCVAFTRKKIIRVGDSAYNSLRQDKARSTKNWSSESENVFIEFKRTMGLNTAYTSSNMGRSFSSEELSAEVLKTLKTFCSDDNVQAAVITIPAKFKSDQIAATKRAAEMAGITHSELLQEPIAAAIAYGLSTSEKSGNLVVFDFGGGTFDAALLSVEDGIMQVKDTEGDNYLGGKNIDNAIVDEILIPELANEYDLDDILSNENSKKILRDALKFYAEAVKNQLSFNEKTDIQSQLDEFGEDDNGEPIELDMVVTRAQLEKVASPLYQKAVDITKSLIKRNHLNFDEINSLILVGGPTYSPILREMLKNQITENVDTSIDPMTAVARGAALYASNIDSNITQEIQTGTIALDVAYEANTVEDMQYVAIKHLTEESSGTLPRRIFIEITRNDKAWSSGRKELSDEGEIFECHLVPNRANAFAIEAYDELGNTIPCFPNEITIMHGLVVGNAVLPYNIGVEACNQETRHDIFVAIKGLEKNQTIPATGVRNGFKVPHKLRPGIESDRLVIPIYQGEHNSDGSSAYLNDHVFDVVITGNDVPTLIPENCEVDLTIKVDASQMMRVEVFFTTIGESVEKDININQRQSTSASELHSILMKVEEQITKLRSLPSTNEEELQDSEEALEEIHKRFDSELSTEDGRMHLLADIRRAALKLDKLERLHEWDTLEANILQLLKKVKKSNDESGNQYDEEVAALERQVNHIVELQDVRAGRGIIKSLLTLDMKIDSLSHLVAAISYYSVNFNNIKWKNPQRARELCLKGRDLCITNPNIQTLHPIVLALFEEDPDFNREKLLI